MPIYLTIKWNIHQRAEREKKRGIHKRMNERLNWFSRWRKITNSARVQRCECLLGVSCSLAVPHWIYYHFIGMKLCVARICNLAFVGISEREPARKSSIEKFQIYLRPRQHNRVRLVEWLTPEHTLAYVHHYVGCTSNVRPSVCAYDVAEIIQIECKLRCECGAVFGVHMERFSHRME